VAKDVVNANNAEARAAAEAEAAEATPMPDSRYVIARCARDMTAYAGGGERPSGLAED